MAEDGEMALSDYPNGEFAHHYAGFGPVPPARTRSPPYLCCRPARARANGQSRSAIARRDYLNESITAPQGTRIFARRESVTGNNSSASSAELPRSELGSHEMWTKIGMAALVAAFLASTADLGRAWAADGPTTEGGASGNGGPAIGGGTGPSGTALGGGDQSIHTSPSMNETNPGISGGGASGSIAPANGGSTGPTGSGNSTPAAPK
jgi:hypothetical protein